MNQTWLRIIYDYKKSSFPRKNEILKLFESKVSTLDALDFKSGVEQTKENLLKLVVATRRMYEENKVEEKRIDFWSIHMQSITMLENVLLMNDLKD